jgi:ribulose 1,5-bisphosphate carboxylase large subunit-like protein
MAQVEQASGSAVDRLEELLGRGVDLIRDPELLAEARASHMKSRCDDRFSVLVKEGNSLATERPKLASCFWRGCPFA